MNFRFCRSTTELYKNQLIGFIRKGSVTYNDILSAEINFRENDGRKILSNRDLEELSKIVKAT